MSRKQTPHRISVSLPVIYDQLRLSFELAQQLKEERAALERRKKEREEQHLYLSVYVVTESNFKGHLGFDLTSWDPDNDTPSKPQLHRVLRTSTVSELAAAVAQSQGIPPEHLRLWVMVNRQNKTVRPDQPLGNPDMTIESAYLRHGAKDRNFRLWAEQAQKVESGKPLWPDFPAANKTDPPTLIFLKHFDAEQQSLLGVGHVYLKKTAKVADMVPLILQMMGWTPGAAGLANGMTNGTPSPPSLLLYEEIKSSMIEPMKPKSTLAHAEIVDGDIVCFQKQLPEKTVSSIASTGGYTDAREFYDYLLNRKQVMFLPKAAAEGEESTFKLDLSRKMSYEQFSAKVGEHLKLDPTHLRFWTINLATGKPKATVKRSLSQNLSQILSPSFGTHGNSNQCDDRLFYEVLDMSLSELETKRSCRVFYLSDGHTREDLYDILAPKAGTVKDLIDGLIKKANFGPEIADHLRIYEISQSRVHREYRDTTPLTNVGDYSILVAEVIPEEERNASEDDMTIYCFHFDKEVSKVHGIPFRFIVKPVSVQG